MADALKFMIELVDKMSAPATRASLAVRSLDANLIALKRTVGELASMGQIKFPGVGGVGGGRGPAEKQQDSHVRARLAHEQELAKAAAQLDKQRAAGLMAQAKAEERASAARDKMLDKQSAAREKHDAAQLKAAQSKADKEVKLAQKQVAAQQKASEKAAATEKKMAEKAASAQQKQIEKAATSEKRAFDKRVKLHEKELNKQKKQREKAASLADAATTEELAAFMGVAGGAAAAALALGAAIGYVAFQGASLAIAAAEAKNDTLDMLEAMLGTAGAAQETYAALSAMTGDLAASQESLGMLAQELSAAGIENKNRLLESVKAISQVDSVLKGSGAKIQGIIEKAVQSGKFEVSTKKLAGTGVQVSALYEEIGKRMGIGVKEVEAQLKAGKVSAEVGVDALNAVLSKKFGGLAAKQAQDFGAQMQRLKDNFGKLFEDVDTGPFLDALKEIVKVFDATTPAGAALKQMLTTTFDGLFKAAGVVLPYIRIAIKGIILVALKLWNAFRPVAAAVAAAFGGDKATDALTFEDAILMVANGVGVLAEKVASLMQNQTMIDGIVASFRIMWSVVSTVVSVIGAVVIGIGAILAAGALFTTWVLGLGAQAYDAGAAVVDGLIKGLASGASFLIDGARGLANQALTAFKSTFGIASPSKVMMGMGSNLTAGLAKGIDSGAKAANDNMGNVINIESARARAESPAASPAAAGGGGTTIVIQVSEGAININGTNMTKDEVRELFPEMFVDAVERMGLSQGAGEKVA